jgi:hypothetical protein
MMLALCKMVLASATTRLLLTVNTLSRVAARRIGPPESDLLVWYCIVQATRKVCLSRANSRNHVLARLMFLHAVRLCDLQSLISQSMAFIDLTYHPEYRFLR